MEAETKKSNIGLKVALGIALVLFVGTVFYAFELQKEKEETEIQLTKEKELVLKDLSNMAKQYDIVIGDNETANQSLVEAKGRIQSLIDSLQVSETNIESLWKYKSKYLSLQKEMNALLTENDKLKLENYSLSSVLDSTRVRLEERDVFTDSLMMQNSALADVVENAAVLSIVGLKGYAIIEKSSGKIIESDKAKRSDKIRICFTVVKNVLVEAGDQELYVQVIDSKNNTLGVNEQVQFGEKIFNYSVVSRFNYEKSNIDICEFVGPNKDEFEKGRYTINVYNEKELISTTEFTLK